jgi:hypothetical protein
LSSQPHAAASAGPAAVTDATRDITTSRERFTPASLWLISNGHPDERDLPLLLANDLHLAESSHEPSNRPITETRLS